MTTGYGINGIGYSPLGNLGLGSTGTFASYDNCMPSSMGMMGGMPGMYTMPGMMGMYNYMNPEQMTQMGQRIEASQLQHASNMHSNVKAMEVSNGLQSSNALASQMLNEGDIQGRLSLLKNKIDNGDLQGAVQIHKELRELTYNRYKDEIAARGEEVDPQKGVLSLIDKAYFDLHGTQLEVDLEKSGETPFMNGFNQVMKKGHSNMTIQEAKNAIYGTRIDAAAHEQFLSFSGKTAATVGSFATGGFGGAGIGAGLFLLTNLTASILTGGRYKMNWSSIGKWARGGFAAGAIGNTVWKFI